MTTMVESEEETKEEGSELSKTVIIYENERRWVGRAFSTKGLLPTERSVYSTADGSLSWNSLAEASEYLVQKGWVYDNADSGEDDDMLGFVVVNEDNEEVSDEEAMWSYASDWNHFSSTKSVDKKKKKKKESTKNGKKKTVSHAMHWVRRRRLWHSCHFVTNQFTQLPREMYGKCDHCDSKAVEIVSAKMLEVLAISTLTKAPKAKLTDAIVLPLQTKLIQALGVASATKPLEPSTHKGAFSPTPLDRIMADLDKFANPQKNVFKAASSKFGGKLDNLTFREALADRKESIAANCFPKEERDILAKLEIRYLDYPDFILHCNVEKCGAACVLYSPMECPHEKCGQIMSLKYWEEHVEALCDYKVVDCPKGCGDSVPRNRVQVHLMDVCPLRDAVCPFRSMGCLVNVLAKDVAAHLSGDGATSHLLLAANRMAEYEQVIRTMNESISKLQVENESLRKQAANNQQRVTNDIANFSQKIITLTKKMDSMTKSHNKDIQKLKHEMEN